MTLGDQRYVATDLAQALSFVEQRLSDAGCDVVLRRDGRGISIFYPDGQPVARLRNLRQALWEVAWWSHRDKWESIGDFGGVAFDNIEEAVSYVLEDPIGIFW